MLLLLPTASALRPPTGKKQPPVSVRGQPSLETVPAKESSGIEADLASISGQPAAVNASAIVEASRHGNVHAAQTGVEGGATAVQRAAKLILLAIGSPDLAANIVLGNSSMIDRGTEASSASSAASLAGHYGVHGEFANRVAANSLVEVDSKAKVLQKHEQAGEARSPGKGEREGEVERQAGIDTQSGPCGNAKACQVCQKDHGFVCSHIGLTEFKCVPFCLDENATIIEALRSATIWAKEGTKHCFEELDDQRLITETKHHCTKQDQVASEEAAVLGKDLPDDWEAVWDPNVKSSYYINKKCGPSATQWEKPSTGPCPNHTAANARAMTMQHSATSQAAGARSQPAGTGDKNMANKFCTLMMASFCVAAWALMV